VSKVYTRLKECFTPGVDVISATPRNRVVKKKFRRDFLSGRWFGRVISIS